MGGCLQQVVKDALRVTSEAYDAEVAAWIAAAVADLRRVGVRERLLAGDPPDPLVVVAVICFCKCHFGFDFAEFELERLEKQYELLVCDLLNSSANCAAEDDEGQYPPRDEASAPEGDGL